MTLLQVQDCAQAYTRAQPALALFIFGALFDRARSDSRRALLRHYDDAVEVCDHEIARPHEHPADRL